MVLLRLLSWPYFRKHVLRTILTTAGIVLGVAVFVGMHSANRSVLAAFSRTLDRIAGKTELQVTAGEAGFDESVLEAVQSASTVRVAVPVIEGVVDAKIQGQGNLLVLGVDMTGDRSLRDYDLDGGDSDVIDDPLVFLAQPDSLILSEEFAHKNHIARGSRVPLGTVDGEKMFTIRGIMRSSGLARAFGGNLAVMDIYAAQKMFGRGRTFDRIDLAVKRGATLAECERELEALLGQGFDVQPPASRSQQFEGMLAGYSTMIDISSAFALFIGMFMIFNSFSIAVTQRRSEIGILRALGATRRQVQTLFLGESIVMGLVGSMAGLGVGLLIARAIAASIGTLLSSVFGIAQGADELTVNPWVLGLAVALGMLTSLVAAVIPARQAARVDPVHALKKGSYQALSSSENWWRTVLAAALGVASVVSLMAARSRPVFYAGYASAILATVLIGPLLSVGLARVLRPVLQWVRPIEGALAADSLIGSPRRTSASVAALMLSLALVVGFGGVADANYRSIVTWMNTTLDPDLFVLPSQRLDIQTTRFPSTMAAELAGLSGVDRVQMERDSRITFRNSKVSVVALEHGRVAPTASRGAVAGNTEEMYSKSASGEGLIVSENFAELQHLKLDEMLEIHAPYGLISLPIVGIVVDYSDQRGTILMDRDLFIKYWHDDSVNAFRVYGKPGVPVADVRRQIVERYAGKRQAFVLTNGEVKAYIMKIVEQWFGLTSVQIAVAVLVAILGIVNTLTVSIADRRRELGVLQAVGARRSQVRRTIWIEALSVGTIGLILGCALGALNLSYMLQIAQRDIGGMRLDYIFPVGTALVLVPTILFAAFTAAVWPAESAVRGSLVEALEYE